MAIDFNSLSNILPVVSGAGFPVLLRGRHGIGKSESVYQFARAVGLPVVERRASQMTEGDLLGLPDQNGVEVNGRRATSYNPPAWFIECCEFPRVLFVDEIDRAVTEVRQGFFELTDSRKLAGHTLHPETIIIAAVNGGDGSGDYSVADMDPAEADRYTVFDVQPSVEDWLFWANGENRAAEVSASYSDIKESIAALRLNTERKPVDSMIVDFIRSNPGHLEHGDTFEPGKVYPSRRSWKRFSDTAVAADLFENVAESRALISSLAAGFVGLEASIAFVDFAANYERQVTVEDIIDHGRIDRTADFDIVEHTAMVSKIKDSGALAPVLTETQLQNVANYLTTLPSEVAMVLFSAIPVAGENGSINIAALYALTGANGKTVRDFITEMI